MILGLIVLIIGIICLVNEMNLGFKIEFEIVWPLVVMLFSIYRIVKLKKFSFCYTLFAIIGFWYTLYYFNIIKVSLDIYMWPIIFIILGISIITSKLNWNKKFEMTKGTVSKDGRLSFNGIFGAIQEIVKVNDFKGCVANGIFGSVDLDLRNITINDNVTIDANSVFGGIDLIMPEEYNIVVNSFAIFGGNENKTKHPFDENKKTIYVNCVSIFGGTDIK